jgi:hypothetical protein
MRDIDDRDRVVGEDPQACAQRQQPQERLHPNYRKGASEPPRIKEFFLSHRRFLGPRRPQKKPPPERGL